MAFDLDNEELKATRKLHGQYDGLYEDKSDKNVANIKIVIKDCREHLKLYGEAFITANELDRIEHILTEREQDKKRIQELEEQLKGRTDNTNKPIEVTNLYLNSIPKQVVRDKIKELKNDIKNDNTRYPYIKEHKIEILQELLEGEEVKNVK